MHALSMYDKFHEIVGSTEEDTNESQTDAYQAGTSAGSANHNSSEVSPEEDDEKANDTERDSSGLGGDTGEEIRHRNNENSNTEAENSRNYVKETTTSLVNEIQATKGISAHTTQPSDDAQTGFLNNVIHSHWTLLALVMLVLVLSAVIVRLLIQKKNTSSTTDSAVEVPEKPNFKRNIVSHTGPVVTDFAKKPELVVNENQNDLFMKVARVHNIGRRKGQQDSFGVSDLSDLELCNEKGVLAVVADGMGGLKGGDEVSSNIVLNFLQKFSTINTVAPNGILSSLLNDTVEKINISLMKENALKKSGSTLISVIVRDRQLSWVSVGDSRISLFRNGKLTDLNKKHIYAAELEEQVKKNIITAQEATNNPEKDKLTSYIGMGKLKYIDKSVRPMPVNSGDKVILMTDGVFNTLSDREIEVLLSLPTDKIGDAMEKAVIAAGNPYQDNFTAVVLEIS